MTIEAAAWMVMVVCCLFESRYEMSLQELFTFSVQPDDLQEGESQSDFLMLDDLEIVVADQFGKWVRMRSTCFGKTAVVKPDWEDLIELNFDLPANLRDQKAWAKKFRSSKPLNDWAAFLKKPKPLAQWLGAHRMRLCGEPIKTLLMVTDHEGGFELGRVKGRFA